MIFNHKILIDDEEKVLTFYKYPHVFWIDLIKESVDIYENIKENIFYKFLESIYENYISKGYCFVVDEEWEGHDINQILSSENYSYTLFNLLDEFKNQYDIKHRFFYIISSNLYYHFYKKSEYIYPYLHWLKVDNFIQDEDWWKIRYNKKIKYKFVYLNRVPKFDRVLLYDKILKTDILKDSIWSWNAVNFEDYKGKKPNHVNRSLEENFVNFNDEESLLKEPSLPTIESFCSILVESETEFENLFISEKTAKCFIHEIPFVVFASPHFIESLHKLGFKTFDKWWDESYDLEHDINKRIELISNTILQIDKKTYEELDKIYSEMREVLEHNKKLYFDIHNGIKLKSLTIKPITFNKMHEILRFGGNLDNKFKSLNLNNII